jgi:hypothetical protein
MRVSYLPVLVLLIDKFVLQIIICGKWAASKIWAASKLKCGRKMDGENKNGEAD